MEMSIDEFESQLDEGARFSWITMKPLCLDLFIPTMKAIP